MAYIAMAAIVWSYVIMAYIVMACIFMAHIFMSSCSYGVYIYGDSDRSSATLCFKTDLMTVGCNGPGALDTGPRKKIDTRPETNELESARSAGCGCEAVRFSFFNG